MRNGVIPGACFAPPGLQSITKEKGVVMLVLSRKKNERIVIAGGIVITVVEVRGDRVRIGIEAPKEVAVHRQEVQEAIEKERRAA